MLQVSVPMAHELLAQYINRGQALVQRASLVGDFSDYESWKGARKQWIDPTVEALVHVYGGSKEADEFRSAVTPSDGGQRWQQQYVVDLQCVTAAIDLLSVLQGELAFSRTNGAWAGAPELAAGGEIDSEPPSEPAAPYEDDANGDSGESPPQAQRTPEPSVGGRVGEQPTLRTAHFPEESQDGRSSERQANGAAPEQEHAFGAELAPAPIVGSELAQHGEESLSTTGSLGAVPAGTKEVLLAHGRNERWKQAVIQLLEKTGPHEIRILNERRAERGTLVEQVGAHAQGSRHAVVLLTADDVGAPRLESEEEPYFAPRARQGVVFEMGFLVAALTPGSVCVLYEDGVELPCDLQGISYVRLDLAGTWQPKLLLHLRKAGFDYDLNKLAAA
jgi:predicted nucleotide-binding protein